MIGNVGFQIDKRFKKRVQGVFNKYDFSIGVESRPHKAARSKKSGLKTYAGGPARKIGRPSGLTTFEVSEFARKKTDFWRKPFEKRSSDIMKLVNEFVKYAFGKSEAKRMENLLQAVIRNPILKGVYGSNKRSTIRRKGFDRFLIDTGQLFKNIRGKVKKRV